MIRYTGAGGTRGQAHWTNGSLSPPFVSSENWSSHDEHGQAIRASQSSPAEPSPGTWGGRDMQTGKPEAPLMTPPNLRVTSRWRAGKGWCTSTSGEGPPSSPWLSCYNEQCIFTPVLSRKPDQRIEREPLAHWFWIGDDFSSQGTFWRHTSLSQVVQCYRHLVGRSQRQAAKPSMMCRTTHPTHTPQRTFQPEMSTKPRSSPMPLHMPKNWDPEEWSHLPWTMLLDKDGEKGKATLPTSHAMPLKATQMSNKKGKINIHLQRAANKFTGLGLTRVLSGCLLILEISGLQDFSEHNAKGVRMSRSQRRPLSLDHVVHWPAPEHLHLTVSGPSFRTVVSQRGQIAQARKRAATLPRPSTLSKGRDLPKIHNNPLKTNRSPNYSPAP